MSPKSKLCQNDVTQEQAKSTGMPPNKKVNKAEELTYLSTNIGVKWCKQLKRVLACFPWQPWVK